MAFFEGCPVGWGGDPTGAGLVDGGVDQGPWLQERVGGGVGAMQTQRVSYFSRFSHVQKEEKWLRMPCAAGGYPPELA